MSHIKFRTTLKPFHIHFLWLSENPPLCFHLPPAARSEHTSLLLLLRLLHQMVQPSLLFTHRPWVYLTKPWILSYGSRPSSITAGRVSSPLSSLLHLWVDQTLFFQIKNLHPPLTLAICALQLRRVVASCCSFDGNLCDGTTTTEAGAAFNNTF